MTSRVALTGVKLFVPAMEAVQQFQRKYEEAQKFRKNLPDTEPEISAFEKLLGEFAFRHDGTAPTWDGPFKTWVVECFSLDEVSGPAAVSGRKTMDVINGKADPEVFFESLDAYAASIQQILDRSAPAHFSYQGFKIENFERMGESKCRRMLEGLDYVTAVFRKRGVTPLLKDTVTKVRLLPELESSKGGKDASTLGYYYQAERAIEMSGKMLDEGLGRFLSWVNEVFVHEVGHHVHLHMLPAEAKRFWDQGWDEVNEHKNAVFGKVTYGERDRFFKLLSKNDYDVGGVAKKLKGVDKIKFGVWLRSPMMGEPLIKPKQWRLTKHGQHVFDYLRDPAKYIKEVYDLVQYDSGYTERRERKSKQMMDALGLTWGGDYGVGIDVAEEMAKSDPSIAKALAKLEIVSDYGKTDEMEDFADTFVAFMGSPNQLTETAKFRMQKTLSLAGLYGKKIVTKLAFKVAVRFWRASRASFSVPA